MTAAFAVAARIQTARGVYILAPSGAPERSLAGTIITFSLERIDGIERVAFRCIVRDYPPGEETGLDSLIERIARWIEPQFEQLREAALKSIRAERRLLEVEFALPKDRQ